MKALVISGGGSKGAFAGGVAEYLLAEKGRKYDIFVGTSTGSLLLPHLALGEIEKIKKVFTSVKQNDIFDVNPFGFSKLEEKYKVKISYLRLIRRIFLEKSTFGESRNLKKLIKSNFTPEDFERLRNSGKEVIVTVANLSMERIEYKSSKECEYEDFIDWMWASANVVPFMSLLEKDGYCYADGGFGESIPAHEAVNRGAKDIDIIVLQAKERIHPPKKIKNVVGLSSVVINFMSHQLARLDLLIADLDNSRPDVTIRKWYTPRLLTGNYMVFDPDEMLAWWEEGKAYARKFDLNNDKL